MTRAILLAAATAAFGLLVAAPAASLLWSVVASDGRFDVTNVLSVLTDARQWSLLGNTLFLGASVGAATLALGIPLGFLVARTDLPAAAALRSLLTAPLLLPPLVHAIAWTEIVKLRGVAAAVFVFTLAYAPFAVLFAARAAERIDGRMEEAARLAGVRGLWTAVVGRAVVPAAAAGALCAFLFVVSDFSVPDYLSSIGPKLNVYADEIFSRWQRQGNLGGAVAAAIPPAAIGVLGLVLLTRWASSRRAVTLGSSFVPPRRVPLGRWKWPLFGVVIGVIALSVGAPLASLLRTMGPMAVFFESLSQARDDILRSCLAALGAAAVATSIAFLLACGLRRGPRAAALAVDVASGFAFALPAIAFAIALIRLWNRDGWMGAVYTSPLVVLAAFAGRYFLFAHVTGTAGVASLDPAFEDAGLLAGLPYRVRTFGVTARLAAPSLAAGFLLVYVFGMRELDTIVLIPAGNRSTMFRIYNAIHFNRPQFVAALCLCLSLLTCLPIVLYAWVLGRRIDPLSWQGARTDGEAP